MTSLVRIDDDIKQRIKIRSSELGITQYDLLNQYILKGLEEDRDKVKNAPSINEIKARLKFDNPDGNGLEKYSGIAKSNTPTNAVELKKNSFNL